MAPPKGSRKQPRSASVARFQPERLNDPSIMDIGRKMATGMYDRLVLCEGDSWFDIYTPAPLHEPNLLGALRTPRSTLLVDKSRVGDTAEQIATGRQATDTLAYLNEFKFDALLLSAGGNDLKNAFKAAFIEKIVRSRTKAPLADAVRSMVASPASANDLFAEVVGHVATWIGLRQRSRLNKDTPVVLHGYVYLQPRPAPSRVWINGPHAAGPWLHPILKADKKTDDEMREIAKDVIDRFNYWLARVVQPIPGVHILDTRETLALAAPGTTKASNDWMDEIHPTPDGFAKLADDKWNPILATLLA